MAKAKHWIQYSDVIRYRDTADLMVSPKGQFFVPVNSAPAVYQLFVHDEYPIGVFYNFLFLQPGDTVSVKVSDRSLTVQGPAKPYFDYNHTLREYWKKADLLDRRQEMQLSPDSFL